MNLFITCSWLRLKNATRHYNFRSNKFIKSGFLTVCVLLAIDALQVAAQIPLLGVRQIQAGEYEDSCAVMNNGTLMCWGANSHARMGLGIVEKHIAVDVNTANVGATAIGMGYVHSCLLSNTGGVKCWGQNSFGQLGNSTTVNQDSQYGLANVIGLTSNVSAIAVGHEHSCALKTSGEVKCWGNNSLGQVGNGSTNTYLQPSTVIGLSSGVVAIAVGVNHSCALTNYGGVKCWGSNANGALGDGTNINRTVPVDVIGLSSGITKIALGEFHSCALDSAGGVKCWGNDVNGALGFPLNPNDPYITVFPPTNVVGINATVTDIVARGDRTCVLTSLGAVKCWGDISTDRNVYRKSFTPVDIAGLQNNITAIALGGFHGCALSAIGGVMCWGANTYGQLGDNTNVTRASPVVTLQAFSPKIGYTATPGNTQAVVRFSPPANDSGSPVTGYTVTSNPAGGTDAHAGTTISYLGANDLSHLVTGLMNGTPYTFTVTATNAMGTGLPSDASNIVNPRASSSSQASSTSSSIPASSSSQSSVAVSSVSTSSVRSSIASSSAVSSSSSAIGVGACSLVTGVTFGVTNSGTLASTDCTAGARGTNYYTDRYSFTGTPGQLINIQLTGSFDTFVYLKNPSGVVIASDDDGGGGTNSRIPASSGNFLIPAGATGTYVIEVTSYGNLATGTYSLLVSSVSAASSSSSVASSTSSSSLSNSTCNTLVAAVSGVTNNGVLATTDCTGGTRGVSNYTDRYSFSGTAGQQVSILLTSGAFDSYVYLKDPSGSPIAGDDDGAGGTNSRIPASSGSFTLPASGVYVIEVTSYFTFRTGAYSLLLTQQ